jgi:hypothetical protein
MNALNNAIQSRLARPQAIPGMLAIQVGNRALSVGRDFRQRYHRTNPLLGLYPGLNKGYLEVLLFRRWVVVLSQA